MSKLPVVSGQNAVKAFCKIGYVVVRQKGSHVRLRSYNNPQRHPLTIPSHKTLKPGLLRSLIKDAGISVEEFVELLG